MNKRFGKKRAQGCECDARFTCKKCLDAAAQELRKPYQDNSNSNDDSGNYYDNFVDGNGW